MGKPYRTEFIAVTADCFFMGFSRTRAFFLCTAGSKHKRAIGSHRRPSCVREEQSNTAYKKK